MRDDSVSEDLRVGLASRQLNDGGWSAVFPGQQASAEATALAYLALDPDSCVACNRAMQFLLKIQNPNGSWPAFVGDDREGSWTTSLCLLALHDTVKAIPARVRGLEWLVRSVGEESHWLWKWKFRTADRHVRFDPDKFGWPWIPHTGSWVVPTAFSILSLNQGECCAVEGGSRRVELGIQMLLDRACPGGGWNAGNGVVYGSAMAPHPDDTAIALLALVGHREEPIVPASLDWLEQIAPRLNSCWSLAWSILALAAHGRIVDPLRRRLAEWHHPDGIMDNSTLAVSCMALNHEPALARLGVVA
jgi:hypothetical protein